ncbi:MAG: methylenetetrahydrofolate reductase [NAD(P)H] [Turneriella sp.]|nr:methylenetetrahydrofolate reductase [NAD(P)H] [Leptospiraceae bacterium]MCX7632554.1 methylenetetrahydrofolate reductase [NAD(P)H] [Turneriella sp.]
MAEEKVSQAKHIAEVLRTFRPAFSFEFFPPKTPAGAEELYTTISELQPLEPAYVSVTYGAGGSTRELTHDLVVRLARETGLTIVSHLTCIGASREEIRSLLERYRASGIRNILALRGDPPRNSHGVFTPHPDGFRYAAELVAFIKKHFPEMGIGVAGFPEGHPETPNRLKEMEYLKAKVDAGADYICTQLFFDNRDFYDFRERCILAGIHVPIIAGIMPITSRKSVERMAELALGARFPARLLRALARAEDDSYAENVGIHWATEQVRDLLDNDVAGIHFYTLNKSKATRRIYESLGIRRSASVRL